MHLTEKRVVNKTLLLCTVTTAFSSMLTLQLISIYIQAMIQTEKCVKVPGEAAYLKSSVPGMGAGDEQITARHISCPWEPVSCEK